MGCQAGFKPYTGKDPDNQACPGSPSHLQVRYNIANNHSLGARDIKPAANAQNQIGSALDHQAVIGTDDDINECGEV